MNTSITPMQQHWLDHSRAVDESELSLAEYAKLHQLNINAFYNGRHLLRKKGLLDLAEEKPATFIKVLPKPVFQQPSRSTESAFRIKLPNGLQIDVPDNDVNITLLIQGLMTL